MVEAGAVIGKNCKFGHHIVVSANVSIGDDCQVGHGVVLHPDSTIGDQVRIDDHVVVGKWPLRAVNSILKPTQQLDPAVVSNRCMIGTHATVYRGATLNQAILVADQATIRERVTIGEFTIVGRGVVVENDCTVGRYCKLETESYITAYSTLEDRVFIAPQVATSNDNFVGRTEERFQHFKGVTVKRGGRIGVGSVILPGKTIGEDGLVAAGSVVSKDVPAGKIVLGQPAREFRAVPEEQLLDNQGWPE
ncbi:MAG: DapH/DapD/GlmU-related protein [Candidatus Eisenbacteria bacterium]